MAEFGTVMGMTPAFPVALSVMPTMPPVGVLVTVTSDSEASRSSCCLKLVQRSSNFTDCVVVDVGKGTLGEVRVV